MTPPKKLFFGKHISCLSSVMLLAKNKQAACQTPVTLSAFLLCVYVAIIPAVFSARPKIRRCPFFAHAPHTPKYREKRTNFVRFSPPKTARHLSLFRCAVIPHRDNGTFTNVHNLSRLPLCRAVKYPLFSLDKTMQCYAIIL